MDTACALGTRRQFSIVRSSGRGVKQKEARPGVQSHSVVTQLCAQLHGWIDFVALAE